MINVLFPMRRPPTAAATNGHLDSSLSGFHMGSMDSLSFTTGKSDSAPPSDHEPAVWALNVFEQFCVFIRDFFKTPVDRATYGGFFEILGESLNRIIVFAEKAISCLLNSHGSDVMQHAQRPQGDGAVVA